MNAETFHDALTQLPADLIAQADSQRIHPVKRINWKRYGAMAASIALMVCMGLWSISLNRAETEESAVEQAPAVLQAPAQNSLNAAADAAPAVPESTAPAQPDITLTVNGTDYPLEGEYYLRVAEVLLYLHYGQTDLQTLEEDFTATVSGDVYRINTQYRLVLCSKGLATMTQPQADALQEIADLLAAQSASVR